MPLLQKIHDCGVSSPVGPFDNAGLSSPLVAAVLEIR